MAQARTEAEWARAYGILAENRRGKGRRLALSLDYVRRVRDALPGRVRAFLHDPRRVAVRRGAHLPGGARRASWSCTGATPATPCRARP